LALGGQLSLEPSRFRKKPNPTLNQDRHRLGNPQRVCGQCGPFLARFQLGGMTKGEDIPILLIILQMPVLSSVFFNLKLRVFWSENTPT
jgi:hypothetical protein